MTKFLLIFGFLDLVDPVSFDHEHFALAEFFEVLEVCVSEADDILQEGVRVLDWIESLEGK